jgi:hypothetical protein
MRVIWVELGLLRIQPQLVRRRGRARWVSRTAKRPSNSNDVMKGEMLNGSSGLAGGDGWNGRVGREVEKEEEGVCVS